MKRFFRLTILAIALLLSIPHLSDAKTRKSRSSTSKAPSIEAIYGARENPKEMKALGLKRIYKHETKINSCEIYGINVKVAKTRKGVLKFTATGPHAFYSCSDESDPPEGAFRDITFYGFSDLTDRDRFYNLLIRDGDENACDTYTEDGWYIIEVNERFY